jgi:hypothetical protein
MQEKSKFLNLWQLFALHQHHLAYIVFIFLVLYRTKDEQYQKGCQTMTSSTLNKFASQ